MVFVNSHCMIQEQTYQQKLGYETHVKTRTTEQIHDTHLNSQFIEN